MRSICLTTSQLPILLALWIPALAQRSDPLLVRYSPDFAVTGDGRNPAWEKTSWLYIKNNRNDTRQTRLKLLYSDQGLYVLFDNEDEEVSSTMSEDFDKLWLEDVVELFLWPDTSQTVYFEYEISPLNRELVLLVPNFGGRQLGWRPWLYDGPRRTRHLTTLVREERQGKSRLRCWMAEVFIPFELLKPLGNLPPRKGTVWRANFYRVDRDRGVNTEWMWKNVDKSFHEFHRYGYLLFD